MQIRDNPLRYGAVSRGFHWLMALLILWQLAGMAARVVLSSSHPLTLALAGRHQQIGTALFLLIVARMVWAALNRRSRPPHGQWVLAVRLGHGALYALMLLVPLAALLRAWGNERAFAPFGFQIFAERAPGEAVGWAVAFGNHVHGEAGWLLGVLIFGHVLMALVHHFARRDGTLRRMA